MHFSSQLLAIDDKPQYKNTNPSKHQHTKTGSITEKAQQISSVTESTNLMMTLNELLCENSKRRPVVKSTQQKVLIKKTSSAPNGLVGRKRRMSQKDKDSSAPSRPKLQKKQEQPMPSKDIQTSSNVPQTQLLKICANDKIADFNKTRDIKSKQQT